MKNIFFYCHYNDYGIVRSTSCSNNEDMVTAPQDAQVNNGTRSVSLKTPKLTTYIETNDINPLNMGEYYFCGTDKETMWWIM